MSSSNNSYKSLKEALKSIPIEKPSGVFKVTPLNSEEITLDASVDNYKTHEVYSKGFHSLKLCLWEMLDEIRPHASMTMLVNHGSYVNYTTPPSHTQRMFPAARVVEHNKLITNDTMGMELAVWRNSWSWKSDRFGIPRLPRLVYSGNLPMDAGTLKLISNFDFGKADTQDLERTYGVLCECCGKPIEHNGRLLGNTLCNTCNQELARDIRQSKTANVHRLRDSMGDWHGNYLKHLAWC